MTAWIALIVAVLANVLTNVSLKLAVKNVSDASPEQLLTSFLTQSWTWIGMFSGGVLLGSYLVAIRSLGLGFSYATVTSLALVLITTTATFVLDERPTPATFLGIALVLLGIVVLTYVELSK